MAFERPKLSSSRKNYGLFAKVFFTSNNIKLREAIYQKRVASGQTNSATLLSMIGDLATLEQTPPVLDTTTFIWQWYLYIYSSSFLLKIEFVNSIDEKSLIIFIIAPPTNE